MHQVVINIDYRRRLTGTKNTDRTQTPNSVDAACRIQCMKSRSKRRQRVGARRHHFTHHIHTDGTHISHRYGQKSTWLRRIQIGINRGKSIANMCRCLIHLHPAELNAPQPRHGDMSVGSNGVTHIQFGIAPYIDDHLIARPQNIVGRRRHIHVRLKSEVMGREKILPENAVFLRNQLFCPPPQGCHHHFRSPPRFLHDTRGGRCSQIPTAAILCFQALQLFHRNPFFRQFKVDLFLRHPGIAVVHHLPQNLFIAHLRKKRDRNTQKSRNGPINRCQSLHNMLFVSIQLRYIGRIISTRNDIRNKINRLFEKHPIFSLKFSVGSKKFFYSPSDFPKKTKTSLFPFFDNIL